MGTLQKKDEILSCLQAESGFVSGENLSGKLGISRTAVWKNVNALRKAGYKIESATNRGYRLVAQPDLLTPGRIAAGLETAFLAKQIFCFDTLDSTNEEAKRQAARGAANGSLFVAEEQTGGKGRLGRSWSSPAGSGLWFSILLRPGFLPKETASLTLLAGLAVCRAVRALTGYEAMIKWPNDVVIGSRKVCGVLTEMAAEMDRVDYVVLGIGVNVNTPEFPPTLRAKATSVLLETGAPADRAALLRRILPELEACMERQKADRTALLAEYRSLCVSLGRQVGFTRGGTPMTGTAMDISPTGELLVRCENGAVLPVFSGEVTVQGIYGEQVPSER